MAIGPFARARLRAVRHALALAVTLAFTLTGTAFAVEDTDAGGDTGLSISSSATAATARDFGFARKGYLASSRRNVTGVSKAIQCGTLTAGGPVGAPLLDILGAELGLTQKGLKAPVPGRPCQQDQVQIQAIETFGTAPNRLYYLWGLSQAHYGDYDQDSRFGQSGLVHESNLVNPPTALNGSKGCSGSFCNTTKSDTLKTKSGAPYYVIVDPRPMQHEMWHPQRSGKKANFHDGYKATRWLFNTTAQYGAPGVNAGVTTHAPLMYNWLNQKRGGVNRAQVKAGTKFYLAKVEPVATYTYKRGTETRPIKHGSETVSRAYKIAGKNGWIEVAYGFISPNADPPTSTSTRIYGWMVMRHKYGRSTPEKHYIGYLPWERAAPDVIRDSFSARAAQANGTDDDDVVISEDEFDENPTEEDLEVGEEDEYYPLDLPGQNTGATAWGAPANSTWGSGFPTTTTRQLVGDVNGDGRDDAVTFDPPDGRWKAALSTGDSLTAPTDWQAGNGNNATQQWLADINGDGMKDAVVYYASGNVWFAAPSWGGGFGAFSRWDAGPQAWFPYTGVTMGDVNGDGREEPVFYSDNTGEWWVGLNTGSAFSQWQSWTTGHGPGAWRDMVKDMNGDGKADAVSFIRSTGTWKVALSTGSGFGPSETWIAGHGTNSYFPMIGDVNGDGLNDAMVFFNEINWNGSPLVGAWFVAMNTGTGFTHYSLWAKDSAHNANGPWLGDINGDKQADAIGYYPLWGGWIASKAHDIRDPRVSITSGPSSSELVTTSSVGFTFKKDESGATLDCSVDGGAYSPCTSPVTLSNLADDRHSFVVRATDLSGKTAVATSDFTVDTRAPETVFGRVGDAAWAGSSSVTSDATVVGDVSGDGRADAVSIEAATGTWRIAKYISAADSAASYSTWATGLCVDDGERLAVDVNADQRADAVCYNGTAGVWTVALSTGTQFGTPQAWATIATNTTTKRFVEDVNNDSRADVVTFDVATGEWKVALSSGSGFGAPSLWRTGFGIGSDNQMVGDVTGDHRADIVSFTASDATWKVARSTGTAFSGTDETWRSHHGDGTLGQTLADVDGDAKVDAVVYFDLIGTWYVARSTGNSFSGSANNDELWISDFGGYDSVKYLADVTGDQKADAVAFYARTGNWYAAPSTGSAFQPATVAGGRRAATFHSDDPFASFKCSIDGGAYAPCAMPTDLSGLADGSHTLAVRAVDALGHEDATPVTTSFTVASPVKVNFQPAASPSHPGYLVDGGLPYGSRGNGHTYGWKSGAVGTDISSSTRDRNSANSPDQRYDTLVTFQFGTNPYWEVDLPNGTYTVRVVAGDPSYYDSVYRIAVEGATVVDGTPTSSNRWIEGTQTVSVNDGKLSLTTVAGATNNKIAFIDITPGGDTSPPETTITTGPADGSYVVSSTSVFSFSSESGAAFECKVDAGAYGGCTSPWSTGALADGTHSVSVRARDASGNADPTPATRTFVVDTVTPDTSITSAPSGPVAGPTATIQFVSPDTSATFECKLDSGSYSTCASPYTTPSLAPGSHSINVRAKDPAGNLDATPAVATIQVQSASINVNFQPAGSAAHPGYLVDGGLPYGSRGNGHTYGWKSGAVGTDISSSTRDRNSANSPDQRYDTLVTFQFGTNPYWEIDLPNGAYSVHVVAGDPSYYDSVYRIAVEGTTVVDGTPTTSNRWIEGTQTVTVSDGKLTLTTVAGASNNKIAFIDITPQ